MSQTLLELCGDPSAPPLHMAPANGFPPQTYLPMLRGFCGRFRAICAPPRALWGDQKPPADYRDWSMAADDLLLALRTWNLKDVLAVGHSMGGVSSLLAALREPSRFRALVLLDPVFLLLQQLQWFANLLERGAVDQLPLVQAAKRRRRRFASRDEAFRRFRSKPHFADWSDDALRLYVDYGLTARIDGAGYELTWSVEWEAYYYSTIYQRIWQTLPEINGLLPILVLRGENSDTFTAEAQELARSRLPAADFRVLEGQGHLFPQAAPEQTAAIIHDWLTKTLE